MARKRFISPQFWENEDVLALGDTAVRCAIGSWSICDRNGIFEWRPRKWVHKFAPRSTDDPDQVFQELIDVGFVARFDAGTEHYGFWIKWSRHQDPHINERPQYPMPINDPRFSPCRPRHGEKPDPAWVTAFYGPRTDVSTGADTDGSTSADSGAPTSVSPSYPSRPSKEKKEPDPSHVPSMDGLIQGGDDAGEGCTSPGPLHPAVEALRSAISVEKDIA